ncbi:MAG: hypothetical protein HUJ65_07375 [Oscillospiraceae bacterium]|nr:hypothetical protein [Oscillospiraceae bacterium]
MEDCTRQTRVKWLHTKEKEYILNLVGMLYDTMMNIVDNEELMMFSHDEQDDARRRMDYMEKLGAMAKSDMWFMERARKTECVEIADKVCRMLRRLGDTADIARAEEGGEGND